MGDALRRRTLNLPPRGLRPDPPELVKRHVLALIDRRISKDASGELVFTDHSAKPNTYASADLHTLYRWDGVRLRRLDKLHANTDNRST